MKLLRLGPRGAEKPAMLDSAGYYRDLSGVVTDINGAAFGSIDDLARVDPQSLPVLDAGQRIGPCVGDVGKFICIGLNYEDHARETGQAIPDEPIVFMKATSAINGPNDDVIIPKNSTKSDFEVELGIVIGAPAQHVAWKNALDYVAGYCVINDLSERAFQLEHGGQWVKGKSCDTFGPLGPWLVTKDEVSDPGNLNMWLEVDGNRYQDGSTRTMIFGVSELVSYVSRYMTLLPGDVISSGTPPGVGFTRNPPVSLEPGQTIRLGIDGLGEQCQKTISYEESLQ